MITSQIYYFPDIGPILFEKSMKANRVNITIRPFKGVRVAVPRNICFSDAVQLIVTRIPWIRHHLQAAREEERTSRLLEHILPEPDSHIAKRLLAERLKALADQHGFIYTGLTIRRQRTRWGSCSYRNRISLNIKLACLPDELRDFVILHELVHTKIKNHGPNFKSSLAQLVDNIDILRVRLRDFQAILYN